MTYVIIGRSIATNETTRLSDPTDDKDNADTMLHNIKSSPAIHQFRDIELIEIKGVMPFPG